MHRASVSRISGARSNRRLTMSIQIRKHLLASSIMLAVLASGGVFAADTACQNVDDSRREAQIWTTYALSPYLRANDLGVSVKDGKATLSGDVEESVNRDLAEQIARGVKGINNVDNKIVVRADYTPRPRGKERSYGEMVDDVSIATAVRSKLQWSKHTEGLNAKVDVNAGRTTLTGTAATTTAKDLAGRLAMSTRGVVSVDNKLTIAEAKAADPSKTIATSIADSWITTKVKSMFMYSDNVHGSDISVHTDKGVVSLSGTLGAGAERALVIELAENVRGVNSVNASALSVR